MPKSRPPYPPEFRRRMVELVRAGLCVQPNEPSGIAAVWRFAKSNVGSDSTGRRDRLSHRSTLSWLMSKARIANGGSAEVQGS